MRSVFEYSDFRSYLQDYHRERKTSRTGWSLVVWARQLGLKSPSSLLMILKGQRNPSPKLTAAFAQHFRFSPRESDFFGNLVELAKHGKDVRMSVLLMEKLSKDAAGGSYTYLDHVSFSAVAHWYYYAVREMVQLPGFRENPYWIAKKLKYEVTAKQIREAIQALLKLRLLERGRDGKLKLANGNVATRSDYADEGLKRFHEGALENARSSLRTIPPEEREILGSTVAIARKDIGKAKTLIRRFQKDLCDQLECTEGDSVYHLEIALFPLIYFSSGGENASKVH